MDKIGITYEELVQIYDKCGHAIKQPNSVKAIAGALNVVASRLYQVLDDRIAELANVIMTLGVDVSLLKKGVNKAPTRAVGMRAECYCGTPISSAQCETCKRIHANH